MPRTRISRAKRSSVNQCLVRWVAKCAQDRVAPSAAAISRLEGHEQVRGCRDRRRTSGSRTRGSGGRGTCSRSARTRAGGPGADRARWWVKIRSGRDVALQSPRSSPSPRRRGTGGSRRGSPRRRRCDVANPARNCVGARPCLALAAAARAEHDPVHLGVGLLLGEPEDRASAADLDVVGMRPEGEDGRIGRPAGGAPRLQRAASRSTAGPRLGRRVLATSHSAQGARPLSTSESRFCLSFRVSIGAQKPAVGDRRSASPPRSGAGTAPRRGPRPPGCSRRSRGGTRSSRR